MVITISTFVNAVIDSSAGKFGELVDARL